MLPDENDTIAAIASAPGASLRGVVRVSGPNAIEVAAKLFAAAESARISGAIRPVCVRGVQANIQLSGVERPLPVSVYVWPDQRSYTRQPSVEVHLPGSPPLLQAVVRSLCLQGARLAQPGEFTLRAVLGGRLDLTQAEAVLGVIDAQGDADLDRALKQLAGGLANPLKQVREDLLSLLADIEAGLDFVEEEGVRFIEPIEIANRLEQAIEQVRQTATQGASRSLSVELPTVVLTGSPNAGKSTLYNALVNRCEGGRQRAIVSATRGSTRDSLAVPMEYAGRQFELVDTAGKATAAQGKRVELATQTARAEAASNAAVVIDCLAADAIGSQASSFASQQERRCLRILTKCDLASPSSDRLRVSAQAGEGIPQLLDAIAAEIDNLAGTFTGSMLPSTAARSQEAISEAEAGLRRARLLVGQQSDELISLELQAALAGLGRVLGDVVADDVLDRVFSRFCIGK